MHQFLILASILVLLCVFSTKALYRFGVPSLLIFIALGMIMGSDGIGGIYFDNFQIAENVSTLAIVLIIFYGGFGTKWGMAKPVAAKAMLLSSLGTVTTAFIAGFFCHIILKVPFLYGLLFGAVVSSTDAASVFSILRSRRLSLKNNLAPLLEIESGSNDPFAYMMTVLVISIIRYDGHGSITAELLASLGLQLGIGLAIGVMASVVTVVLLKRLNTPIEGVYPILLMAIVILSYSACFIAGGNGLLCVYVLGIVVGNSKILHKQSLVHFYDALSWIMQIVLFFLLGLLSFPSRLPAIIVPGMLLSVLIIVVARPVAVLSILSWFKIPMKHQALTSWVGLRGAASVVFAIAAVRTLGGNLPYDLFHLVFFVALFSIAIQGTLTPLLARKLDLVDKDDKNSVMKTFTDYYESESNRLHEYKLEKGDKLSGKCIVDTNLPDDIRIIMIKRGDDVVFPKGSTELAEDDILVISGDDFGFFGGKEL